MEHRIMAAPPYVELERIYLIQATLKTFKGRKDVLVHLFRNLDDDMVKQGLQEISQYEEKELVGKSTEETPEGASKDDVLRSILEAFTAEEGNLLLEYLKENYDGHISEVIVCPLELPIPLGLVPFSVIPEGKTLGFIRFDAKRGYSLPFSVHGFYDLSAHEPMVGGTQE